MALIHLTEFPAYGLPKLQTVVPENATLATSRPLTTPTNRSKMVGRTYADRIRKEEYFEILDETIRTNPYRKAATAMASVMAKHGIDSHTGNVLGKPSPDMSGFPEKKCALTRALKLAQNCNLKLTTIKEELQTLCSTFGKKHALAPAIGGDDVDQDSASTLGLDKAGMTGHLVTLIGEAETIARRIYETAVGLHVAEDYLRQPEDLKVLDFSSAGRIQIPNYNFNHASQLCLEWLHSTAIKWLRGFKEERDDENIEFIKIFESFTKAVKDYTEAVCLANQVFRVLLYPNPHGKECLQEYILSLGHVLKNDIIMEVQALRRAFDSIQYTFERVGWAASIALMKYSGKNITVETLNETGIQVDHSTFQYKFYEGPPKTKLKKKGVTDLKKKKTTKGIASSLSLNKDAISSHESFMEEKSTPKKKGETDMETEPTANRKTGSTQGENLSKKLLLKDQDFEEEILLSRRSRSIPDMVKPKKGLKKKIKKKVKPDSSEARLVASAHPGEDGSQAYSHSALTIAPTSKSKTSRVIRIPQSLQQQLDAVFGTRVMPLKSVKSMKRQKSKAGLKCSNEGDGIQDD